MIRRAFGSWHSNLIKTKFCFSPDLFWIPKWEHLAGKFFIFLNVEIIILRKKSLETSDLLNPENRTLVTTSVGKIDHEFSQPDSKKCQQREEILI